MTTLALPLDLPPAAPARGARAPALRAPDRARPGAGGGMGARGGGGAISHDGFSDANAAKFSEKTAPAAPQAAWRAFQKNFSEKFAANWREVEKRYYSAVRAEAKKSGAEQQFYADLGKRDLYWLAKEILGYQDMVFHLHYPLCALAQESAIRRKLILIPRKHFKTSCVTIAGAMQWILNDPDIAILLGTGTSKLVRSVMGEIKAHFTHNETFRGLYPECCPDVQTDWGTLDQFTVPNRRAVRKEPTMLAASTGTKLTGMSFDCAKLDDLINEENCTTREQIEAVEVWYEYLKFLLKKPNDAVVDMAGTRYHFEDIYGRILTSDNLDHGGRYACYVRKALESGRPIFPERFNTETLAEWRGKTPTSIAVYEAQAMQNPVPTSTTVEREKIRYHDDTDADLRGQHLYLMLDASVSQRDTADFCAFVIVGATANREKHIHEAVQAHLSPQEFVAEVFRYVDKYAALGGLKAITLQRAVVEQVLRAYLDEEMRKRGVALEPRGRRGPGRPKGSGGKASGDAEAVVARLQDAVRDLARLVRRQEAELSALREQAQQFEQLRKIIAKNP